MMKKLTKGDGKEIFVNVNACVYIENSPGVSVCGERSWNTKIFFQRAIVYVQETVDEVLKILGSENDGKSSQD